MTKIVLSKVGSDEETDCEIMIKLLLSGGVCVATIRDERKTDRRESQATVL